MKILLIGNGFDLEHNLPTSYRDFLIFCDKVRRIFYYDNSISLDQFKKENLDYWDTGDYIKGILQDAYFKRQVNTNYNAEGSIKIKVDTQYKEINELYANINNNIWYYYFFNRLNYIGENWIDFEMEISRVIKALDSARFQVACGGSMQSIDEEEQRLLIVLLHISKKSLKDIYSTVEAIDTFSQYLKEELDRLVRALEIYIAKFVSGIPIKAKSADISNLHPDCVLSFNYSNTYERVYGSGKNIEYDYIHGKADINKNTKTCDLVLGIDEYLDDDDKDKQLEFLTFKKYYQRIYKSTGNKYLDWIDEINGNLNVVNTLYIFGHSLDVTDKDILKMFICNDNVQTKIFYYRKNEDDKVVLGKLIKNLIKIIGQEELIRRTGGTHKTIEFIQQAI